VLRERILARARAGGDASEATLEVLARQIATAEPVAGEELAFAFKVDTTEGRDALRRRAQALGARLGVGSWRSAPS
jgi:predicted kinase